jgi:hypothetical protein
VLLLRGDLGSEEVNLKAALAPTVHNHFSSTELKFSLMYKAVLFCCVVWLAAGVTRPLSDPDLWWHLSVGRWIVAHGTVPRVEYWNQFALGKPWIAYSWSHELVFALIEKWSGMRGLFIAQCGLALVLASAFVGLMIRLSGSTAVGLFLGAASFFGVYSNFALRPQSTVWLLLAGIIFFSNEILEKGWCWKRVLGIVLCFIIWANTHITTALGLLVALVWTWQGCKWSQRVALLLLIVSATLITPYGGAEWLTFFSKVDHPIALRSIVEFGPGTILDVPVGVLLIVISFYGALAWTAPRAVELRLFGLAGIMMCGGLAVVKFLPFAHLLTAAASARVWKQGRGAPLREGLEITERMASHLGRRLSGIGSAFLFLVLAILKIQEPYSKMVDDINFPVKELDMVLKENLPFPLLNSFGQGGYVMYRLTDSHGNVSHPVPIDGRTNVNSKEATITSTEAFIGTEKWRDYLNLVNPSSVVWPNDSPLVALLVASKEWCRVFRTGATTREGSSLFITREEFSKRDSLLSDNCSPTSVG